MCWFLPYINMAHLFLFSLVGSLKKKLSFCVHTQRDFFHKNEVISWFLQLAFIFFQDTCFSNTLFKNNRMFENYHIWF